MEDKRPENNLYKIFSKESLLYEGVQESGDVRSCRLCGAQRNLHSFTETYTKNGVEQRYHQLVFECFGVQVKPPEQLVCEKCMYQLLITERFRAQILSAFSVPNPLTERKDDAKSPRKYPKKRSAVEVAQVAPEANKFDRKWRFQKKSLFEIKAAQKRVNLYCSSCRQRYPMLVPFEGWQDFICSRCKKDNSCRSTTISKRNISLNNLKPRLELHTVPEHRGKNWKFGLNNKPLLSRLDMVNSKYQFRQQRYASRSSSFTNNLRVRNDFRCTICGKDMKTWDLLERHNMRMHGSQPLYRCDICRRVFKDRTIFQNHYLNHGKQF